jgi:hypothetical protein
LRRATRYTFSIAHTQGTIPAPLSNMLRIEITVLNDLLMWFSVKKMIRSICEERGAIAIEQVTQINNRVYFCYTKLLQGYVIVTARHWQALPIPTAGWAAIVELVSDTLPANGCRLAVFDHVTSNEARRRPAMLSSHDDALFTAMLLHLIPP